MNMVRRAGTVTANRHSGGGKPDGFCLHVMDEKTHACVEVWFTPEQWALSMWGRGDVPVQVAWIDVPQELAVQPLNEGRKDAGHPVETSQPDWRQQMLAYATRQRADLNRRVGLNGQERMLAFARIEALEEYANEVESTP